MIRAIPNRHLLDIRFERILADRQRRPRYLHSKRASPPYLRVLGNFVPSRTLIALHLIVERKACFCRRGRFLPNLDQKCIEAFSKPANRLPDFQAGRAPWQPLEAPSNQRRPKLNEILASQRVDRQVIAPSSRRKAGVASGGVGSPIAASTCRNPGKS